MRTMLFLAGLSTGSLFVPWGAPLRGWPVEISRRRVRAGNAGPAGAPDVGGRRQAFSKDCASNERRMEGTDGAGDVHVHIATGGTIHRGPMSRLFHRRRGLRARHVRRGLVATSQQQPAFPRWTSSLRSPRGREGAEGGEQKWTGCVGGNELSGRGPARGSCQKGTFPDCHSEPRAMGGGSRLDGVGQTNSSRRRRRERGAQGQQQRSGPSGSFSTA
jgi:hypothetical protein